MTGGRSGILETRPATPLAPALGCCGVRTSSRDRRSRSFRGSAWSGQKRLQPLQHNRQAFLQEQLQELRQDRGSRAVLRFELLQVTGIDATLDEVRLDEPVLKNRA